MSSGKIVAGRDGWTGRETSKVLQEVLADLKILLFDDQLEVRTLIIQKSTVIPPSLMMDLLLRKFLRHGNFKNIDKVSISNTPLGGIDKAMMDDVKRDWEE